MVTQPRGGREHESKCPSSPDDGADEEAVEGGASVLLFDGRVFVGSHRGAFVVLGSQASPTPLWLVSVWFWSAMVGKMFEADNYSLMTGPSARSIIARNEHT